MKNKKWLWRSLTAIIVAGLVWFYWPRSLLDIAGLRDREAVKIWVYWSSGIDNYGTKVVEDPDKIAALLSALDEVRFQEELYFGGVITLVGSRDDYFNVYMAEGGYADIEFSSGGDMVYRDYGSRRSRVFHIIGDPKELKPLFDMVDSWPDSEK